MWASTSSLNWNITRARRCGLVAAQPGWTSFAAATARSSKRGIAERDFGLHPAVVGVENITRARWRRRRSAPEPLAMKWSIWRMLAQSFQVKLFCLRPA